MEPAALSCSAAHSRRASPTLPQLHPTFAAANRRDCYFSKLLELSLQENTGKCVSKQQGHKKMKRLAFAAAFAICVVPLVAQAEQNTPQDIVHGTVNIAIGNENGLVVLTDSMLTSDD